jgi:hypothetical protein
MRMIIWWDEDGIIGQRIHTVGAGGDRIRFSNGISVVLTRIIPEIHNTVISVEFGSVMFRRTLRHRLLMPLLFTSG